MQYANINFYDKTIRTTVTSSAITVDDWIAKMLKKHSNVLQDLVVGLDTEWFLNFQPNGHQPVAILQLCIDSNCLIFQLRHADYIPQSLSDFLENSNFTFVGVNVQEDAKKLLEDYKLKVSKTMDVASELSKQYGNNEYKRMGLKRLMGEFYQQTMEKPKRITLSKWGLRKLSYEQVEYATIDAFASFKLGILIKRPEGFSLT